jgi:hypothetical protein
MIWHSESAKVDARYSLDVPETITEHGALCVTSIVLDKLDDVDTVNKPLVDRPVLWGRFIV